MYVHKWQRKPFFYCNKILLKTFLFECEKYADFAFLDKFKLKCWALVVCVYCNVQNVLQNTMHIGPWFRNCVLY